MRDVQASNHPSFFLLKLLKKYTCSHVKVYQRHLLVRSLPATPFICSLLSGCVCTPWLCSQCWEPGRFALRRSPYTFRPRPPSALRSAALPPRSPPGSPWGKEKPRNCLPEKAKRGGVSARFSPVEAFYSIYLTQLQKESHPVGLVMNVPPHLESGLAEGRTQWAGALLEGPQPGSHPPHASECPPAGPSAPPGPSAGSAGPVGHSHNKT